jgi:hypothetical protein
MATEDINDILKDIETSNSEFIADIKKYWYIVSGSDSFNNGLRLDELRSKMPKVPSDEWNALLKEFDLEAMEGEFVNQFMKNFTHKDLKGILKLYETNPILKKFKDKNKIIVEETYKLNLKWTTKFTDIFMLKTLKWKSLGYI